MVDLDQIARRWAAAFSGQADVKGLSDDQLRLLDTGLGVRRGNDVARVLVAELAMLLAEVRERRKLHDLALSDLHDLVKLALELRAYGKARIALSDAHEAWVDSLDTKEAFVAARLLDHARNAKERALDRVEALAVHLAGGDVARVCEGEGENRPRPRCPERWGGPGGSQCKHHAGHEGRHSWQPATRIPFVTLNEQARDEETAIEVLRASGFEIGDHGEGGFDGKR